MPVDYGKPPRGGWAKLVSELLVDDLQASLTFWTSILGFSIAYQRPEDGFVYLERPDGGQIMLCQRAGYWETATMERPYGRGVMFQIYVARLAPIEAAIAQTGWPLYAEPREVWRRWGDREGGKREVVVQDPDGYLILVAEDLGERPLPPP